MKYLQEMAEQGYSPDTIRPFDRVMIPYLLKRLDVGVDDLIVDAGAAQGHGLIPAKEAGYRNLAAIDIDPFNFDLFRDKYGIRCLRCNLDSEPIPLGDEEVALFMSFHLIEHLRHPEHFLAEARRVLKSGGKISIVTPDWRRQYKTFWRDPTHLHPYDKESIARLLRMSGFADVRTSSWGPRFGLGRLSAFKWWPKLAMIGVDMLATAIKR